MTSVVLKVNSFRLIPQTAPADYTAVTVPLVFDSTTSRVCVNISTLDDSIYEDSEVFDVNVDTGDPNVIVAPDTGEITIRDVDGINNYIMLYDH